MEAWFAFVTPLLLAAPLAPGSVTGTVRDADSLTPLAGAVVSLIDLNQTAITDSVGRYDLENVVAGPQHMVVRRIGYAPRTLHALVPREGALEIDILLHPVPIRLSAIDVKARVPVRGLEDMEGASYPDRGLTIAAVRHHPLLAEPDALEATGGGEVILHPESPSGLHVRGGASDQIAYLLDGFPVLNPYHSAGTFSAWNPDALSHLDLIASSSPAPYPDALSGVVAGRTRTPGPSFRSEGGFSTTQARVTVDGPIARPGAGYLLSLRSTFPGLIVRRQERSYVRGDGGDWLGKIESPLFSGHIRLLGYGTDTEIDAAARAGGSATREEPIQNHLTWHSRSWGIGWTRPVGGASVELQAWSANGEAGATWSASDTLPEQLFARRRDEGAAAMVGWTDGARSTSVGTRFERSRTAYRVHSDSRNADSLSLHVRTPESVLFVQHSRPLAKVWEIDLSMAATLVDDGLYADPSIQLRWRSGAAAALSGGYARRHQFAQSLRNPESIVSTIYPVDLYVGKGDAGVPVARSDLGILAVEIRPLAGLRLGVQGYLRALDGLALVAPRDADPFAATGFVAGTGSARGVAFEASVNGARYAILGSYGFQRVRLEYGDTSYVPEHGAAHAIDAGVVVFPSATSSVRLGMTGRIGRRATATLGTLEWEDCNLLDQGCEFAGSPGERVEPLGATRLPAYVRVDLGLRKHWHARLGGRDCLLAVFGTVSNVLGRKNVLTVTVDPDTRRRTRVEMRPRAPLVVGVDWRF